MSQVLSNKFSWRRKKSVWIELVCCALEFELKPFSLIKVRTGCMLTRTESVCVRVIKLWASYSPSLIFMILMLTVITEKQFSTLIENFLWEEINLKVHKKNVSVHYKIHIYDDAIKYTCIYYVIYRLVRLRLNIPFDVSGFVTPWMKKLLRLILYTVDAKKKRIYAAEDKHFVLSFLYNFLYLKSAYFDFMHINRSPCSSVWLGNNFGRCTNKLPAEDIISQLK